LGDAHLRFSTIDLAFTEGDIQQLNDFAAYLPNPADLAELIRKASGQAGRSATSKLPRLSQKGLDRIRSEVGGGGSLTVGLSELKRELLRAYLSLGEQAAQTILQMSPEDRIEWLKTTLKSLEPSIKTKGRLFRKITMLPAAPFVYTWMGQHILREYKGPKTPEFKQFLVYHPTETEADDTFDWNLQSSDGYLTLLQRFAPILIQEIPENPAYPGTVDLIGKLRWIPLEDNKTALLPDWRFPAVYAHYQLRRIGPDPVIQLIYTHWYAIHPSLKFADAEAGNLEGLTVRITLDMAGHPHVYETIYNCGCYHRMYVSQQLENLARKAYGEPLAGKTYALEKKTRFKIDLIVLDALPEPKVGERPILFCWGSYHLPGKISIGNPEAILESTLPSGTNLGRKTYELLPYHDLETLPLRQVPVGIFNHNGLVYGAGRPEGLLLSPTGIYYAGHPRQRGTQLIHFDQEDFEDPDLFVNRLRWPGLPEN
jgi:hypothetical protein